MADIRAHLKRARGGSMDKLAPRNNELAADVLERLVVGGDMSALTATQRLQYYKHRCQTVGLDPGSRPFQYLALQGRLTLYADKGCAQQLASARGLSFAVTGTEMLEGGVYKVTGRVTGSDGRATDDCGTVFVGNAKGDALANAVMKAHTKAHRRAVLNHCGLGMLDETEIATIPEAVTVPHATAETVDQLPQWAEPTSTEPPAVQQAREALGAAVDPDARAPYPTDKEPPPPDKPRPDKPITDKQRKMVFAKAHRRIEELQAPRDMVNDLMADLARKFNTSKDTPLRMPQMDDALAFVDKWYPGEDAPEPGSDG